MSPSNSNSSDKSALIAASAAVAGAVAGVVASQLYAARSKASQQEYQPRVSMDRTEHPTVIYNEEAPVASRNSFIFPHNHEERMRRQIAARQVVEEENAVARDSVTVRVPATSANMGPGCKLLH
jgi:hypothetical protein